MVGSETPNGPRTRHLDCCALERTFAWRRWRAAVERPRKHERQCIDVTLRQNWIAEIRPPVTHQICIFEQVRGVTETERVTDSCSATHSMYWGLYGLAPSDGGRSERTRMFGQPWSPQMA